MAASLSSFLTKEKINMSPVAALKLDFQPKYDEEYLSIEEQSSIKLEMFLIDNLLVGFRAVEEIIVDFEAELMFIAD